MRIFHQIKETRVAIKQLMSKLECPTSCTWGESWAQINDLYQRYQYHDVTNTDIDTRSCWLTLSLPQCIIGFFSHTRIDLYLRFPVSEKFEYKNRVICDKFASKLWYICEHCTLGNTRRWPNASSMSNQRWKRWHKIKTALGRSLMYSQQLALNTLQRVIKHGTRSFRLGCLY